MIYKINLINKINLKYFNQLLTFLGQNFYSITKILMIMYYSL